MWYFFFLSEVLPGTISSNLLTNERGCGTLSCSFETRKLKCHVDFNDSQSKFGIANNHSTLALGLVIIYGNYAIFFTDVWLARKQPKSIIEPGLALCYALLNWFLGSLLILSKARSDCSGGMFVKTKALVRTFSLRSG